MVPASAFEFSLRGIAAYLPVCFQAGLGDQHRVASTGHGGDYLSHLLLGLAQAQNHFGEPSAQRSVMIDFSETEVLIGEVADGSQNSLDALATVTQRFQVAAEVNIVHLAHS